MSAGLELILTFHKSSTFQYLRIYEFNLIGFAQKFNTPYQALLFTINHRIGLVKVIRNGNFARLILDFYWVRYPHAMLFLIFFFFFFFFFLTFPHSKLYACPVFLEYALFKIRELFILT